MNTQPPAPSQAELENIITNFIMQYDQKIKVGNKRNVEATDRAKQALIVWAERSAKRRELEARRDTISDMIIECHNERRRLEAELKAIEEKK